VLDGPALGAARLRRVTDDFLSRQLPRNRPLWELLVVPQVERDRAAIVGKVHHAMVDGLAAVELGLLLFDAAPDSAPVAAAEWKPAPGDGPLRLLLDSLADSALEQFRAARGMAALGLSPGEARRVAGTVRRAALSLADDALRPAPPSYLNVPIGPRRTLVKHRVPIHRAERLKQHYGVSLNDVILAIAAGALRRLAVALSEPPEHLRVMIPVSVRRADDADADGNRITFAFIELPVAERDPAGRVERIRAQTLELKESGRIAGTELLLRSAGSLPEPLKRRAARLAASPRLYNLTVSNVPGPRIPLYAAGARVASIYPVIPVPDGHAFSLGVLSYGGGLHFSAYADPGVLGRMTRFPAMLEDAVEEVAVAAGVEARPRLRRRRASHGSHGLHDNAGERTGAS
jgi:WS/DGAT/MGAT family acyltransferase